MISRCPSFWRTWMPGGRGTVSFPLGPSTCSSSPICTLTPLGIGIGFFPTLDIMQFLRQDLPDPAENLPADVFFPGGGAGHDSARGGDDVNAQPAEHPRHFFAAHVHAAART